MAAYNPYKATASIVKNKGLWANAKLKGKGDEDVYHQAAKKYYQELYDNGYAGIAKELEENDYEGSLSILARLSPESEAYSADTSLADANTKSDEIYRRAKTLEAELEDKYGDIYDEYKSGEYRNDGYYKSITDDYGKAGDKAAAGAVAAHSADNGGNIDSYGAANAARQRQTYLDKGYEAAEKAAENRYSSLIDMLESMTKTRGDTLSIMQKNTDSDRDTAIAMKDSEREDKIALAEIEKLKAEASQKNAAAEYLPSSGGNPGDSYRERVDRYLEDLIALYPDYSEELARIFLK